MKRVAISILAMFMIGLYGCQQQRLQSPVTKKVDQVDDYFGTKVSDPYRWLEDDTSAQTEQWVKEENKVTFAYLDKIPFRKKLEDRLTEIWQGYFGNLDTIDEDPTHGGLHC